MFYNRKQYLVCMLMCASNLHTLKLMYSRKLLLDANVGERWAEFRLLSTFEVRDSQDGGTLTSVETPLPT